MLEKELPKRDKRKKAEWKEQESDRRIYEKVAKGKKIKEEENRKKRKELGNKKSILKMVQSMKNL